MAKQIIRLVKVEDHAMTQERRPRRSRLYVHATNWSVLEDLAGGRISNPVRAFRAVLPEILERLGIPTETKAAWSQTAGCGCGCSPGFVLDWQPGYTPVDYWATVEPFEPEITPKNAPAIRARRISLGLPV